MMFQMQNLNFTNKEFNSTADISSLIITMNFTTLDCLRKMDINERDFLIVVDNQGKYAGVVTKEKLIQNIIQTGETLTYIVETIEENYPTVYGFHSFDTLANHFRKENISFLPILNSDDIPVNTLTKTQFINLHLNNKKYKLFQNFSYFDNTSDNNLINRPWGFYKVLFNTNFVQSKVISVFPEEETSLQKHFKREEYWTIVKGKGEIILDDKIIEITDGSQIFIPKEAVHKIKNTSKNENLIFIEVQTGSYFGEDDIIRLEDKYGRTK